MDYSGNDEFEGLLGGIDLVWDIRDKIVLEGGLALAPFVTVTNFGNEFDASMILLKLKFNYFLTKYWGLNTGFRLSAFGLDDNSNTEISDYGFTLGSVIRF